MGDDPFSFGDVVYSTDGNTAPGPAIQSPSAGQISTGDLGRTSDVPSLDTGARTASPRLQIAGPPFGWLWGCAATATVALAGTAVMGASPVDALVAWVISGPVAFWLLGRFSTGDSVAQASPVYQRPGWTRGAYAAVVVLALTAMVACAVRVGLWWGHL